MWLWLPLTYLQITIVIIRVMVCSLFSNIFFSEDEGQSD